VKKHEYSSGNAENRYDEEHDRYRNLPRELTLPRLTSSLVSSFRFIQKFGLRSSYKIGRIQARDIISPLSRAARPINYIFFYINLQHKKRMKTSAYLPSSCVFFMLHYLPFKNKSPPLFLYLH